jgi:hypothetical protein
MNNKKWLKVYFIVLLLFGLLPFLLSSLWLSSIYEHNTFSTIVKRQIQNNSIYGTALNQNTFKYKLELLKQTKPVVVAIGSSRVMQFRKESFSVPFVNAGGAMNHLNEGLLFIEEMLTIYKPKYILIGLDFWWFNDNYVQPSIFSYHNNSGDIMDFKKIIKPYYFILKEKTSFNNLKYIYNNNFIENPLTAYDSLGFMAIKTSDGFRSDGSKLYAKTIFGIKESDDENFRDTLSRISKGNRRFQFNSDISRERVILFEKILKTILENNIKPIIIVPPVSNIVYQHMNNEKYEFINKLNQYLNKLKVVSYNYHNPELISINDCEFIDGFHGGDIFYQRILKDIYKSKKNVSFNKLININSIDENIKKYKGKVLTLNHQESLLKEVDFLKIGCIK